MKIILSRKGFDSANGGAASPLFADGSAVSLPIPGGRRGSLSLGQLSAPGTPHQGDLGTLAGMLTGGRIGPGHRCTSTRTWPPRADRRSPNGRPRSARWEQRNGTWNTKR